MPDRVRVYVVREAKSPYLYLQWEDPRTGKRRTRSARTADESEAERKRADMEYELNHGVGDGGGTMSWARFVERYAEEKLAFLRKASRSKAEMALARFGSEGRIGRLADADEQALSRHAARLRQAGLKPDTVSGHLAYLRAALNWAEKQKLLARAPAVSMPKLPRRRHIKRVGREEFDRLLAACKSDAFRCYLQLIWWTGLRRTESFDMRKGPGPWPHVDEGRGRIVLPAAYSKSDADDWLPVHAELAGPLAAHLATVGPGERLFPIASEPGNLSMRFRKEVADPAGVDITLHGLRRSFGTRAAAVLPAQKLQRLMRHANIKTTLGYYVDQDDGLGNTLNQVE